MCISSHVGLGDNCSSNTRVVNINTFYPMDRTCTTVEVFSSNPQVGKILANLANCEYLQIYQKCIWHMH